MAKIMRNTKLLDRLSVILLAATGLVCLCYFILLVLPSSVNPLAGPTPIALVQVVIPTRTPSPPGSTPIPPETSTHTPVPTNTPVVAGTPTPSGPTPTLRPTNTRIPTRTPVPTYGPSVTPSPTRSKYPFTAEITSQLSPYQCTWAGIMGGVYDLEGKPLTGYIVHVEGYADVDKAITSGSSQFAYVPGFDESAWDVPINANGPTAGIWNVRLYKPGTNTPISDVYEVRLEAMCGASSMFVRFVQNH